MTARESFSERKGEGVAPEVFRKNWQLPSQERVCGSLVLALLDVCLIHKCFDVFTTFMFSQWCLNSLDRFPEISTSQPHRPCTCTRVFKTLGSWFWWLRAYREASRNTNTANEAVLFSLTELTHGDGCSWGGPPRKSNPEIAGASRVTKHASLSPNCSLFNWVLCWGSSETPGSQDLSQR